MSTHFHGIPDFDGQQTGSCGWRTALRMVLRINEAMFGVQLPVET